MISVNQRTLRHSIEDGIKEAKHQHSSYLVTHVEAVDAINPFDLFENGGTHFTGERFFWSHDGLTLVGLGVTAHFEAQGDHRAQAIKKQWVNLTNRKTDDRMERGTGPVMVGGFSFDPLDDKPSYWEGFPEAGFIIPEILLTINGTKTYLSLNFLVQPSSVKEDIANYYEELVLALFSSKGTSTGSSENVIEKIKDINVDAWLSHVELATERIANGELEKVVLSREVAVKGSQSFSLKAVLSHLFHQQKGSYIFAIEKGDACFIGATPERLIEKKESFLLTGALAGTIGRGKTDEEDEQLGQDLLSSYKNREEHQYVVSMIQQVMEQVCRKVHVPDAPILLKVKDVQHLYTPISGEANSGVTLLDIVEHLHPTPALGGQPREAALKLIREYETFNRGWFASPVGWIDGKGEGEFAVALRSGLLKKDEARLFAGCGIVEASQPMEELEETHLKLRPMLKALEGRAEN